MKLFISRDLSASDTVFVIYDELGKEKYHAILKNLKSKVNNKSVKLDVVDGKKNVVAKIRQLPIVGVSTFTLKTDKAAATLVMVKTAAGLQCRFYGNNWHICGNTAAKQFSIIDVDNAVISAQQKCSSGFELEISDSANELICLLASLCINMVNTVDKRAIQAV